MKNVLAIEGAAQPVLTPFLNPARTDLKFDMPFDFGTFAPAIPMSDEIPAWSPSRPEAPVPKPLDLLFPLTYFDCLRATPPSPTNMRLFNDKISRRRKRGLAPGWMPDQRFSPADMPHLLALAFTQGASGGLDLADIIADVPKLQAKLGESALTAGKAMDKADGDCGAFKALVLAAAASMINLVKLSFSPFFELVEAEDTNNEEAVIFLFDWVSEGIGEQAIRREARRAIINYMVDGDNNKAISLFRFFYPKEHTEIEEKFEEILRLVDEQIAGEKRQNEADTGVAPANECIESRSPPLPNIETFRPDSTKRDCPETPEGVVLTARAVREIRRERRYAEDRLTDGLKILGLYRSMRIGEISFDAYRDAVRQDHFEDAPCFADSGTLKAFENDYSAVEAGRKYVLDRHLKWGKGNNAVSALRIYYAWDAESQQVIVGSAPRHLPISNRY